jgi:transcriptional regulator GlxA family with amidase domain
MLAASGCINQLRATTHWNFCDDLKDLYPLISIEPDAIYTKDGKYWSSAGITAGIDLTLALIEEDLGKQLAMTVAKSMVVYFKRPGGQSQFSQMLLAQTKTKENKIDGLIHWVGENLHQNLSVEILAKKVDMSPRNFARCFKDATGFTPAKFVENKHNTAMGCTHSHSNGVADAANCHWNGTGSGHGDITQYSVAVKSPALH